MSRDSSGNFTLVAGNPVVTATTISSTTHNSTESDIATELTDSLSRSAKGGMLAEFRAVDGAVGAPAISFNNDTDCGLYRSAADDVRMSIGGADVMDWTASALNIGSAVRVIIENTDDVDLAAVSGGLVVGGDGTGAHIAIDANEIQAKGSDTAAATLAIQALGGNLELGSASNSISLELLGTTPLILFESNAESTASSIISRNDGGGNFNIRCGNWYDSVEEYTVAGGGAVHAAFTHDSGDGRLVIDFADTGVSAGDPITWLARFDMGSSRDLTISLDTDFDFVVDNGIGGTELMRLDTSAGTLTVNGNQVVTTTGPAATTTTFGVVELATEAEVTTGTDDSRAVTPVKLRNSIGVSQVAYKTATQTVNNSETLVADSELSITIESDELPAGTQFYALDAWIIVESTTTADWRFAIEGQVSTIDDISWLVHEGGDSGHNAAGGQTLGAEVAFTVNRNSVHIQGIVGVSGTSDTTIFLEWAQGTATAVDTDVVPGSWMKLTRLT